MSYFDLPSWMTLVALILGGGRDLASLVSPGHYWESKGVSVSVEQLSHELDPIKPGDISKYLADLDAGDPAVRQTAAVEIFKMGPAALSALTETVNSGSPEASERAASLQVQIRAASKPLFVRRLMAVRTLGEMKDARALPILRPLLNSTEMFESEYARQAIATIEGKACPPRTATAAERAADLALLPARLDTVIQIAPSLGAVFSLEKLIALLPFDQTRKAQAGSELNSTLLETLNIAGNVRIDAITVGIYPAPPGVPGNYIVVVRGQFDATALCAALGRVAPDSELIDGVRVFHIDEDAALLVPSDRRIVYLGREAAGELGIAETIAALRTGSSDLAKNVELLTLVKSVDHGAPLWAAALLTPGLKELKQVGDPLGMFDSLTIVATQSMDKGNVVTAARLVATASDQPHAQQGMASMQAYLNNAVGDGQRIETKRPDLKPFIDFLESAKLEAEGNKVSLTASLPETSVLLNLTPAMQTEEAPPAVPRRVLRPRR